MDASDSSQPRQVMCVTGLYSQQTVYNVIDIVFLSMHLAVTVAAFTQVVTDSQLSLSTNADNYVFDHGRIKLSFAAWTNATH